MTIEIQVDGGKLLALVDNDLAHLARYRWRMHPGGYVVRYGEQTIRLSHVVVGRPLPGFSITWLNGDRLDNRRKNLVCLPYALQRQRRGPNKRGSASGVAGVYWAPRRGKWRARAAAFGRVESLGYFATIDEAAAAVKVFKDRNSPFRVPNGE